MKMRIQSQNSLIYNLVISLCLVNFCGCSLLNNLVSSGSSQNGQGVLTGLTSSGSSRASASASGPSTSGGSVLRGLVPASNNAPQTAVAASANTGACRKGDASTDMIVKCTNAVRNNPRGFIAGYSKFCSNYESWLAPLRSSYHSLGTNDVLSYAAWYHANDMAVYKYFDHTGRDGSTPTSRAAKFGYHTGVGENIAFGQSDSYDAVMAWMCSDTHRENMLLCRYDSIGAAYVVAGDGTPYYAEEFSCHNGNCVCR